MKSVTDKKISGVLAGIAEYFSLDPTLVRIGYTVMTIFGAGFPGIVLYVVMALVMPNSDCTDSGDGYQR